MSTILSGDSMLFTKVFRSALRCNKNKYLVSISIPFFTILITLILAVLPYLFSVTSDTYGKYIPDNYYFILPLVKCFYFLATSILTCMLYSTVSIGEEALYSGRMMNKKHCFRRFLYWLKPSCSFKATGLRATLFLIKSCWTVVFLLPACTVFMIITAIAFNGGIEPYLFISLFIGGMMLTVSGLIFRFIVVQRYFLAFFLLSESPEKSIMQCIKQSKNLLDGHIFKVVRFKLCFLPYILLSLFILPIFFVYPQYKQSRSIIAKELIV